MTATNKGIMALDIGERRVGIATASSEAQLATPLTTLERGESFWADLTKAIASESISLLVVGYPRSMSGESTAQTATINIFAKELQNKCKLPIVFQDETLTSVRAKEELDDRGRPYEKGDIDALAATYILTDYINQQQREKA